PAETLNVETTTLDAALAQVQSIDLLKIDVEGGEGDVLRGGRAILRRSNAPIVQFEFSHKNMDRERLSTLMETLTQLAGDGLRLYRRGAVGPVSLPGASEAYSGNVFLARDGDAADRLQRALARTTPKDAVAGDGAALALLRRILDLSDLIQRNDAVP